MQDRQRKDRDMIERAMNEARKRLTIYIDTYGQQDNVNLRNCKHNLYLAHLAWMRSIYPDMED